MHTIGKKSTGGRKEISNQLLVLVQGQRKSGLILATEALLEIRVLETNQDETRPREWGRSDDEFSPEQTRIDRLIMKSDGTVLLIDQRSLDCFHLIKREGRELKLKRSIEVIGTGDSNSSISK